MNKFPYTPKEDEYTPEAARREQNELLLKAARRCAYDLKHCAETLTVQGSIGDRNIGTMFARRADMWIAIFVPEDGPKDYRHRLHAAIVDKDRTIDKLVARCKEHGIATGDIVEECPF